MTELRGALALCLLSLAMGCPGDPGGGGTDSGNAFRAALSVSGEGETLSGAARGVGSITAAELVIDALEFSACGGSGDDAEIDYEGPFAIDLLLGSDLGAVELGMDAVCSLEIEREPGDDSRQGHTLLVEGVTSGGLPFRLESAMAFEIEVEDEQALAATLTAFDLLFDVDAWFDGLDPDAATVVDGRVVIDSGSNAALLPPFEAAFLSSARLALAGR